MQRVMVGLTSALIGIGLVTAGCDGGSSSSTKSAPAPVVQQPHNTPASQPSSETPATAMPSQTPSSTAVHPVDPASSNTIPTALPPVIPPKTPDDPKVATFAGLRAPKPATWIWHPPQRQFAVAEYAVPGRDGHDQARIDVFKAGGTVQMNVDRWKMQFRTSDGGTVEPVVTQFESDKIPVTLVELAGEYKGMGMVNWSKDQLFLCAIVQTPGEMVFVRFVGPVGTVEPNRGDFMNMIQNIQRIEPEK